MRPQLKTELEELKAKLEKRDSQRASLREQLEQANAKVAALAEQLEAT